MSKSDLSIKERIVAAVLNDIYENTDNEQAFNDMLHIRMKLDGYKELVEHYAKQIIEILSKKEEFL